MLRLQSRTSPQWIQRVKEHLSEVLIDHAHCEKKAAGTAMNLLFAYVEQQDAVRELSAIVREELDHFQQVLDLLERRGIRFRRLRPGGYGRLLHELVRKSEPQRAVDRLLVAALIEARSCERFGILQQGIEDAELSAFYGGLFEAEARHHATYLRLAEHFAPGDEVAARLHELATHEAAILQQCGEPVRMHSH
jgi:tRNA-(ms[2]io[6]A)-hydroxylase